MRKIEVVIYPLFRNRIEAIYNSENILDSVNEKMITFSVKDSTSKGKRNLSMDVYWSNP